jgi:hypothetical protein
MKYKLNAGLFFLIALVFIACAPEKERLIAGKWSITHTVVGGSPSSFWFKSTGTVIAPWEKDNYAMQSVGTYDFIDDTHIKITMNKGYYQGNVYIFEIIKLNDKELQLGGTFEVLYLIRSNEKE